MHSLAWIAAGFVSGSLPFSYWIGKLFLHKDIREFGDHAPGATNVARAGGKALYIIAILLDAFKGTIPVWLAQAVSDVQGWTLAAVAVAPVLGHAFTPFLRFRGGMAVATVFGVWLGLLGWLGPVILGVCVGIMFVIQKNWVWASVGGATGLIIFLLVMQYPIHLVVVSVTHAAVFIAKRYSYLKAWPELQPWFGGQGKSR